MQLNAMAVIRSYLLRLFGVLLISCALAGCNDTVTTRFADFEQAQSAGAFERGWLPPILPPSTTDIVEKNDLDLNIGEGLFSFSPADRDYFITNGAKAINIDAESGSSHRQKQLEGYGFLQYSRDSTSWLIAVHPEGRGAYWVEQTQSTESPTKGSRSSTVP
jgi:hypothetical protein